MKTASKDSSPTLVVDFPSDQELRSAVLRAVENAGTDLFKTFLNDYKQATETVAQAA
ncbi:MAG: hypothetical protein RLZ66_1781 [Pseudomonadota bacterium]|jgi:tRNA splicing ligase